MISGFFGSEDAFFFEIELIASDGLQLPVDALLDTGFSDWIAIDNQDLDALNWIFIKQQPMRTARGDFNFDIYAGTVRIDGQEFNIPVHVGEGLSEVLLGREWSKTRRLVVDFQAGLLTLG